MLQYCTAPGKLAQLSVLLLLHHLQPQCHSLHCFATCRDSSVSSKEQANDRSGLTCINGCLDKQPEQAMQGMVQVHHNTGKKSW